MAKISTYVVHVPKPEDIVIGTQVYTELNPVLDKPTRNFTVQSIVDIAIEENPFKSLTTTGASGASTLLNGVLNIPIYDENPFKSLTTTGTSGAATLTEGVLNIPNYTGIVGPPGAPGSNGADGANGANGTNGADGSDGAPGSNGADGANGAQGVPGADGTSIEIQGTVNTVGDLPAAGNTVGDLWVIDQTGGGATAGDGYVWTVGNTWLNIGPLRGPQGVQGIAGTNGADGVAGTPGATGPAGADGSNGANGAPGATGPQGETGPQGPAGGVNLVTQGANIVVSPTAGDVVVSAPDAIVNTADNFGGPKVVNIVCLTSGQYPPATVDGNTLYVII